MWSSSLTDSTSKGKPDIKLADKHQKLSSVNDIFEATTKPIFLMEILEVKLNASFFVYR